MWEAGGHRIAVTGANHYAPDYYGEWYVVRCLACDGQPDDEENHVLWRGEEVPPDLVQIDAAAVVDAVVEHLTDGGVLVSHEVAAAARTMAALTSDVGPGLTLLCAQLGGRQVLLSD